MADLDSSEYELTADFRRTREELRERFRQDLKARIDQAMTIENEFRREVALDEAACTHLRNTFDRMWTELLEPAPLTATRRQILRERAVQDAYNELDHRSPDVQDFRDFLIQECQAAGSTPAEQAVNGGGDGTRAAFITPILQKEGWSILDWANKSRVDFHTANNYLKGKTKPFSSTRKKLAESLGVTVDKLPK